MTVRVIPLIIRARAGVVQRRHEAEKPTEITEGKDLSRKTVVATRRYHLVMIAKTAFTKEEEKKTMMKTAIQIRPKKEIPKSMIYVIAKL